MLFSNGLSSSPSVATHLQTLKECSRSRDLEKGKSVHLHAAIHGLLSNIYISNTLINMYGRCRSMEDAQKVFHGLQRHTVVSWNCLIQGFVDNAQAESALEYFHLMESSDDGCCPDTVTYVHALSACAQLAARNDGSRDTWLKEGRKVHSKAVATGCCNRYVENMLLKLYFKSGNLYEALANFDQLVNPEVVSWNILIHGCVENGESDLALEIFHRMESSDCEPNARTYLAALTACVSLAVKESSNAGNWFTRGKCIYFAAVSRGCSDVYVESAAIDMHGKCGDMATARYMFERLGSKRTTVTWNSLLQGYVDNREYETALELMESMPAEDCGCVPDERTYVVALAAIGGSAMQDVNERVTNKWLVKGRELYSRALREKRASLVVRNMSMSMYSRCGSMRDARAVFDEMVERDTVSWNTLLQGYVENGDYELALNIYDCMVEGGTSPDAVTFLAALTACAKLGNQGKNGENLKWLKRGKVIQFHTLLFTAVCESDQMFLDTKLIEFHSNCGDITGAQVVFDSMLKRDILSWNSLMQGYVENGNYKMALTMVLGLYSGGGDTPPNSSTVVAALEACGRLTALQTGKAFHAQLVRGTEKVEGDAGACLVKFYGRCGSMSEAEFVFDSMAVTDIHSWNAILCGYSQRGDSARVCQLFERMQEEEVQPDEVSFTHILSSCSHGGETQRGRECFESMQRTYGVNRDIFHFGCMLDLLMRSKLSSQALQVVEKMPFQTDEVTKTIVVAQ